MFEKLPYVNVQSVTLGNKFTVFCYTDGLTDVESEAKQMLELKDIISLIEENIALPPSAINKKIVDHLVAFKGARLINDDVSILTCVVY
ncbi:MAG: SpoIIE family protein phosphatase [Chitinophagaceae bacterium]|nr:SpoIIE family protein phosphatase [Chitinophagaceae bacterium]